MKAIHTKKETALGLIFCYLLVFAMPMSFAQEIPITWSPKMDQTIFDGKWSHYSEWKPTSSDQFNTESGLIHIRSAHADQYIYILLDVVADKTFDYNEDHAVICFDSKSEQKEIPDTNDYCFLAKLGSDKAITLQGTDESGKFEEVGNHVGLIAVGGVSDENDRHSKTPHTSYEFRIPIELLERIDHYGFFVKVFDKTKSNAYTWPTEIKLESNSTDIASPSTWGLIYSPDKSLPEYDLPILVLILGSLGALFLSSKNKKLNLFYINR